jgi:hypothetical protein
MIRALCLDGTGKMCMSYAPATDPMFVSTLEIWFRTQSEILALIRFRCGAGNVSFELFRSFEALSERIGKLPPGACITAFKRHQLPLRGVVDDDFITKSLAGIPDGEEYVMVETVLTVAGKLSWFHHGSGVSHAELLDDLHGSRGVPVAVGLYPPLREDSDDVIDAVVPDPDGIVRAGPY